MSAPSLDQTSAPDRDITVDFAIAVERLRLIGISVRHDPAITSPDAALWSEENQTIYLRPSATFWAKLFVLADLHALHTQPGHISPSSPLPRLTLVPDEPHPNRLPVEPLTSGLPWEPWKNHDLLSRSTQNLPLQRQPQRIPRHGRVLGFP